MSIEEHAIKYINVRGTMTATAADPRFVDFQTEPSRYRHWRLAVTGRVATLTLAVDENAGLRPGYKLKLNSYDLGVDIELHDALQRIRFEHPAVATVVITSGNPKSFCAGANIYMLGTSSHRWKVNFCKFTNETRNGMEDSSLHDGLRFVAAINGSCAGGGYEIALACDEIVLIDDRSTAVSLPEVPLLGVLPGTGGLTRLVDKRCVRRDIADLFCTNADGVRAKRALEWGLVDAIGAPSEFAVIVAARAEALAQASRRPADAVGIVLRPLARTIDERGYHYPHVDVTVDREYGTAALTVRAPLADGPDGVEAILAAGDAWWPLAMARELDDALLTLRTNEPALGLLLLRTQGDAAAVLRADAALTAFGEHWFVRETVGLLRRTLARLEVTSRSLFALVEPGSAFAGTLFELALAADRIYLHDVEVEAPQITLSAQNFGAYPTAADRTRLETRFHGHAERVAELRASLGTALDARGAQAAGLITSAPDELDWDDEIRLAIEERVTLSPDALTGLEASLRFPGPETMRTKIFGRLSAWQNWIFVRPNATGPAGALNVYGSGSKPHFDGERV
jgi:benzoyl-CoA-dihydrodiol lyase